MGIFSYEVDQAEVRSSISASLLSMVERLFRGEVGMAEEAETGYQTATCRSGWEYLSGTGLPNTPFLSLFYTRAYGA